MSNFFRRNSTVIPLSGPVQQVVASQHRGEPVEDLRLGAAEGVEDGIVGSAGKGVLTVSGDTEVDDALLLGTAYDHCMLASE